MRRNSGLHRRTIDHGRLHSSSSGSASIRVITSSSRACTAFSPSARRARHLRRCLNGSWRVCLMLQGLRPSNRKAGETAKRNLLKRQELDGLLKIAMSHLPRKLWRRSVSCSGRICVSTGRGDGWLHAARSNVSSSTPPTIAFAAHEEKEGGSGSLERSNPKICPAFRIIPFCFSSSSLQLRFIMGTLPRWNCRTLCRPVS
jgi:hypothetical protein